VKDVASPLPHMLPPPAAFAAACDALGIKSSDDLVLYDGAGLFSAARGWWMFRAMGHAGAVSVLDGGLPCWRQEGRPLEAGPPAVAAEAGGAAAAAAQRGERGAPAYVAAPVAALVLSREQVQRDVAAARTLPLLDARPAGRFTGAVPEPRAGLRGGHVPGSRSLPFSALLQTDASGRMLAPDQLRAALAGALRVEPASLGDRAAMPRLAASCGTGVTACVLALAAAVGAGRDDVAVYDGSWTEWGGREDTPIDVGEAQ